MQFADIENDCLEVVAGFIKKVTTDTIFPNGVPLFLVSEGGTKPVGGEFISLRVSDMQVAGEPTRENIDANGYQVYVQNHELLIELMSYRGTPPVVDGSGKITSYRVTPTARLSQIKQALFHNTIRDRYLSELGVAFLETTGITDVSTILDEESRELRARMSLLVNVAVTTTDVVASDFANSIKTEVDAGSTLDGGYILVDSTPYGPSSNDVTVTFSAVKP